jgi:PEGA domain/Protein of unknown function (DUF2846)
MKRNWGTLCSAALPFLLLLSCCSEILAQDGTVVVYRTRKYVGSALRPSVYVDGTDVGRLGNGRYMTVGLPAGKHLFKSSMKNQPDLEINIKANETVYLEMLLLPGNWRGGGRLVPVSTDDAKTALLKLKPVDDKEANIPDAPGESSAKAEAAPASDSQSQPPAASDATIPLANISIKSTPTGADINVDGKFMGSTPSTIQLSPGQHFVSIEIEGMKPWQRTMSVTPGGNVAIDATLEKP